MSEVLKPITEFNIMDIELYPNYFLVQFLNQDGQYIDFELDDDQGLGVLDITAVREFMQTAPTITFNGNNYDLPILALAFSGATIEQLKAASDKIIVGDMKPWAFYRHYKIPQINYNHIDIKEVLPGVMVSLKSYGGRIKMPKLQDLPYDPDISLTDEQKQHIKEYCKNDLQTTLELFKLGLERVELRRAMSYQYGVDLRSKSDAQVAEAVVGAEWFRMTNQKLPKPAVREKIFYYQKPDYIKFETEQLQNLLNLVRTSPFTAKTNGVIEMVPALAKTLITIGQTTYKLGIGGLHSQESEQSLISDDTFDIYDVDFASYYPYIILINKLYPQSIGETFLEVYRELVERRLAAKNSGDRAVNESLKITINGTFGKLGSVYSTLYAPDLMIQVTMTGQLTLLMLIEKLELAGLSIVSANTDGIVIKCPNDKRSIMRDIITGFEVLTEHTTEESHYQAIYSRDVNNYIAIYRGGKVKTKGAFSNGSLQKNPVNDICNDALIAHLKDGASFEDTITNCKDITKFLNVRTVRGGGVYDGRYLGKVVRWFYSTKSKGTLNYKISGNKVPRTDGAYPAMDLPTEFPDHIDYDWYIRECHDLLMDVGLVQRPPVVRKTRKAKGT